MSVVTDSLIIDFNVAHLRLIDCDIFVENEIIELVTDYDPTYVCVEPVYGDEVFYDLIIAEGDVEFDIFLSYGSSEYPWYEGDYVVIPKSVDQSLHTKETVMRADVLVTEVPTSVVGNEKGYTFTIL